MKLKLAKAKLPNIPGVVSLNMDHVLSISRVLLRSYKTCRQLISCCFFNFSSTPKCFCHRVAKMFSNKRFIRFWRLRQIAKKRFFARYADRVWSGIAHTNITCFEITHCDWLKPIWVIGNPHWRQIKRRWKSGIFSNHCLSAQYGVRCHLKNRNKPRFSH